jgi:hypothetical protein
MLRGSSRRDTSTQPLRRSADRCLRTVLGLIPMPVEICLHVDGPVLLRKWRSRLRVLFMRRFVIAATSEWIKVRMEGV